MKTTMTVMAALALSTAGAQTTIKLASLAPLSGGQSAIGTQARNGIQLAVTEYQPQFKKLGLTLQFVPFDDQADPATGTAAARKIDLNWGWLSAIRSVSRLGCALYHPL